MCFLPLSIFIFVLDFCSGESQEEERVHGRSGEEVSYPLLHYSRGTGKSKEIKVKCNINKTKINNVH